MPMIEFLGRQHAVTFQRYDDRYKRYRRMLHRPLGPTAVSSYSLILESEARKLLLRLLDSPQRFMSLIELYPAAVILRLSFGYLLQSESDPLVASAREVRDITTLASAPGRTLLDIFPWLSRLPRCFHGVASLTWAESARKKCQMHLRRPVENVREQMCKGTASPSIVQEMLDGFPGATPPSPLEEDIIHQLAGSLFAGGTDTSFSTILSFVLHMTLHPEVLRRAHEEIDTIVGEQRFPVAEDRKELPYLDCIIQELHRISPAVPLVPHYSMADDVYDGFLISKGATVCGNIWAICRDATVYPRPEVFDPTRFLAAPGKEAQPDPRDVTFGFGARACPGRHVAEAEVFTAIAHLIWAFDICPAGDKPGGDFTFGHVS
ncbi:cytochrome P450 [Auricularia subglabra TFB-10046 SS5]|nr:cytochrome P450 [Auricularia subglabra TFB-10046 SS5]